MKPRIARVAALCVGASLMTHAAAFSTLGTKWDVGVNSAENLAGNVGTPGGATWSIMGVGLSMSASNDSHGSTLTSDFGLLIGGPTMVEEIAAINNAMNTWAAVSGFVNLGMVADGGTAAGASDAAGGQRGDLRFGAGLGFGGELAHAWWPSTEVDFGADWNKGGDVHVNTAYLWVDDANDTPGLDDFDFETVMLHEIGHALGLGHSGSGTVMNSFYEGGRRSLSADDIAGITHIYGAVPEPTSMAVLGLGALAMVRRRRSKA